ncbi:hypothetical protein HPB50_000017 [Hyalomma asiaticum]|uniref:Uncharacterized protein n=1 Tax=Hyalomma asiaticum TaxID=266040 RepID=A0ACB7RZR8_HYAAI|nr:hypothetical protein HPB50_000017 [Hyalomma asiaticum]
MPDMPESTGQSLECDAVWPQLLPGLHEDGVQQQQQSAVCRVQKQLLSQRCLLCRDHSSAGLTLQVFHKGHPALGSAAEISGECVHLGVSAERPVVQRRKELPVLQTKRLSNRQQSSSNSYSE